MDAQQKNEPKEHGRAEIAVDVAARSTARGLGALLDRPMDPGPVSDPAAPSPSAPLFPLDHWLRFAPAAPMSELGTDGHPQRDGSLPSDLPRRMWAGSSIAFSRPVFVGQRLRRVTTTESVAPKQGSTGRLCFVTLRHEISADGALALVERQTLVYREAAPQRVGAGTPPRPDAEPPKGWAWSRQVRPDEVALFRYSALTFNAHRIHYDLAYATGVEGYPGLVVHGPLMATYLLDAFLRASPDAELLSFSFAARSPAFAKEQLHLCGRPTDSEATKAQELAVVGPEERTIMTGLVTYR